MGGGLSGFSCMVYKGLKGSGRVGFKGKCGFLMIITVEHTPKTVSANEEYGKAANLNPRTPKGLP